MNGTRQVDIEDLFEIVLVGDAQIHPDGSKVAFVRKQANREQDDYISHIWLWEDGGIRQYTAGKADNFPRWSPDGTGLAFLSTRSGKPNLFVLPADGGEARGLLDSEWEVSDFAWAPDNRSIAFVRWVTTDEFGVEKPDEIAQPEGGERKPGGKLAERVWFKTDNSGFVHDRRRHIYLVEVETGDVRRLTAGDTNEDTPSWSPDGRHIVFAANRNPRWDVEEECQIWEIAAAGGDPRQVTSQIGSWHKPVYSPSGDEIAFAGYPLDDYRPVTGFTKLWTLPRAGVPMKSLLENHDLEVDASVLTDTKVEVQQLLYWTELGIWFLTTESGSTNIYRWCDGLHRETDGKHDIRDFSLAGDRLAYTCSEANRPAEIFIREVPGKRRAISEENSGYLRELHVAVAEEVSFPGSGGEAVHGWMLKPARKPGAKSPLVVYIHGGPQAAYGGSFFHEMQVLSARGYGVLLINPHGSASYGEGWVSSIHGDWGGRDFEDVMAATDMAASLDWVDENRIAIAGGSYGGYMAAWAIGHTDRYAAAVVERGLTNMLSFVGTTDIPVWCQYVWRTTVEEDAMKLWSMSPMAYLGRMSTPTLIIHSENDHRCPVEQGEQLFVGLRRRGVPTRFVRFPEESHNLSRGGTPSRRIQRLEEIACWLQSHLG